MSQASTFHVGIVLDGNRRWAKAQGLPTMEGHRQGAEVFKAVALKAFEKGITHLSAFVFSNENWSRTKDEVGYLMKLVIKATESYLDDFNKAGIKILILGERAGLSPSVLKAIERTVSKTAQNTKGTLALCFNYGGQQELVRATQQLIQKGTAPESISIESITAHLYEPEVPVLDLLIRTSGEKRTSGFMLWRAAYAELAFTNTFWPDFSEAELDKILDEYHTRERRFGA
ncbi:MAG: uppS [Candidatus Saccharibacteria bacterium]|nr:uppS [Candidatus Saccharibacteria bacterium]